MSFSRSSPLKLPIPHDILAVPNMRKEFSSGTSRDAQGKKRRSRVLSRRVRAGLLSALLATASCQRPPAPEPEPGKKTTKIVLGYYAGYLADRGFSSVTSYADYLTHVSADTFNVTSDGAVKGTAPADLLAFDRGHDIRTFACVANFSEDDFDADLAHDAVVVHRAKTIAALTDLVGGGDWEGINVDFEGLYPADRGAFTRFIRELAAALHGRGLKLAVSVPAKSADDPGDDWSWPFDYAALGAEADLIQLMTYDEHGPWGDPGPVAGYEWMERCVQYAVTVIDPAKLLIGLPAYGYDWNLSDPEGNGDFAWRDVAAILAETGAVPSWDGKALSARIAYTNTIGTRDGAEHVAWFETPEGIAAKSALAVRYSLAGVSMWVLGDEDLGFWEAVGSGLR